MQPEMQQKVKKSDNLQYDTAGRWEDAVINPPSDVSVFILIEWE